MEKVIGFLAVLLVAALGEWNGWMTLLLILVVLDFVTGLFVAFRDKTLKSKVGFIGLARKGFIWAMVLLAHKLDAALGGGHMFRDATIMFYIINELLSLTENCGRLGWPVPKPILQAIDVLKQKEKGDTK